MGDMYTVSKRSSRTEPVLHHDAFTLSVSFQDQSGGPGGTVPDVVTAPSK